MTLIHYSLKDTLKRTDESGDRLGQAECTKTQAIGRLVTESVVASKLIDSVSPCERIGLAGQWFEYFLSNVTELVHDA